MSKTFKFENIPNKNCTFSSIRHLIRKTSLPIKLNLPLTKVDVATVLNECYTVPENMHVNKES